MSMHNETLAYGMPLDTFTQAYVDCALWSSTDDDGDSLDQSYSDSDIAPELLVEMIEDCRDFQEQNRELFARDWSDEQAGQDFWLTRNRHGAGFWDRGYDNGSALADAAHAYGSVDLFVGDDGKVYA